MGGLGWTVLLGAVAADVTILIGEGYNVDAIICNRLHAKQYYTICGVHIPPKNLEMVLVVPCHRWLTTLKLCAM
jgi:hypothetical protein